MLVPAVKVTLMSFFSISDGLSKFGGTYKTISLILSLTIIPIFAWQYKKNVARKIMKSNPKFKGIESVTQEMESRFKPINVFNKL